MRVCARDRKKNLGHFYGYHAPISSRDTTEAGLGAFLNFGFDSIGDFEALSSIKSWISLQPNFRSVRNPKGKDFPFLNNKCMSGMMPERRRSCNFELVLAFHTCVKWITIAAYGTLNHTVMYFPHLKWSPVISFGPWERFFWDWNYRPSNFLDLFWPFAHGMKAHFRFCISSMKKVLK